MDLSFTETHTHPLKVGSKGSKGSKHRLIIYRDRYTHEKWVAKVAKVAKVGNMDLSYTETHTHTTMKSG